jgi:TonB family protein
MLSAVLQKPRDSRPAAAEPVHAAPANKERTQEERRAAQMREADEVIFEMLSWKDPATAPGKESSGQKRFILPAIGAGSLLVVLGVVMLLIHHGAGTSAHPPSQPATQIAVTTPTAAPSMPVAGQPSAQGKPSAAVAQQMENAQPSQQDAGAASTPAVTEKQAMAMDSQLNAKSIIQRGSVGQAPESAGAAGADGLAAQGAIPSVFNGGSQPVVVAGHVNISSGVATGMVIQKTVPIYPAAAKMAHIGGTVVLQATIAKDGRIRDLHAVSGPDLLRQAAVDAVKNWRYRPYLLNNQPVEVETTVNVVFNLGS